MNGSQRVGIDVSKRELVWSLVDARVGQRVTGGSVANTPEGWEQLLARTPADVGWVLEPTGRYSEGVAAAGLAAGREVLAASPRRARAFCASRPTRAKTDRVDSQALAWYGLSGELPRWRLKSETVSRVDQLLKVRRQLSGSLTRFQQQAKALPEVAAALRPAQDALVEARQQVDAQLRAAVAADPALAITAALDEVPGIGPVTAALVGAALVHGQFPSADAFVAYCGLDLTVRDSGERRGHRRLSKEGPGELRRLLYLCAQASLRPADSPFRVQYERERAKGLSTTAALCAVARKLAKLCWSLWKHGTGYDPERVYRQPTARPATVEIAGDLELTP